MADIFCRKNFINLLKNIMAALFRVLLAPGEKRSFGALFLFSFFDQHFFMLGAIEII